MTTIAYRDGILAADSRVTDRGLICGTASKIAKSPTGELAGIAGPATVARAYLDWFSTSHHSPSNPLPTGLNVLVTPPELPEDDAEGLLIKSDGSVFYLGPRGGKARAEAPFFAIGSGMAIAMGAMAAGATAEQAVNIACDLDAYTGGPVVTLTLDFVPRMPSFTVLPRPTARERFASWLGERFP